VDTTLHLNFKWAVVELCPTCSFSMQRVAIANERRGNGASVGEHHNMQQAQQQRQLHRHACFQALDFAAQMFSAYASPPVS
jgi:hypothetical protein